MKKRMAPNIVLAIVLSAAVVTVALRAAARPPVPGTESVPVTMTAGESRPQTAVTISAQDDAGHEIARPSAFPRRPTSLVEQMQHVFHELHADGFNALCAVCDGRPGGDATSTAPNQPLSATS